MPITASAKKALRSTQRKHVFNLRRLRAMRRALKCVGMLLLEGKRAEAQALVPSAYKAIDKAAKRGVIKNNAAARKKSRLMARLRKAEQ